MAQETIQSSYVREADPETPNPETPKFPMFTPTAPVITHVRLTNMAPIVWGVVLGNLITGVIGALVYMLTH